MKMAQQKHSADEPQMFTLPKSRYLICTVPAAKVKISILNFDRSRSQHISYQSKVEICRLWQKRHPKTFYKRAASSKDLTPVSSLQKQNGLWCNHWSYHSLLLKGLFVRHLLNEKVNKTFYKSSHKRKIQLIHGIPGGMVVGIPVKCGISYHHGFVSFVPEGSMVA